MRTFLRHTLSWHAKRQREKNKVLFPVTCVTAFWADTRYRVYNHIPCLKMMKAKTEGTAFVVPKEEIAQRRERVQKEMVCRDIDGLLVVQRIDLFYFTGTFQNGALFIPSEGEPLLIVKKYFPRARAESPLSTIVPMQSVKDIPGMIREYRGRMPERLGFEWDVMPMREFKFYERLFSGVACVDGSSAIHAVRSIKSNWEIAQMERAANISLEMIHYVKEHVQPGDEDIEVAALAEAFARSVGHGAGVRIRDYQKRGISFSLFSNGPGNETSWEMPFMISESSSITINPCGVLPDRKPITIELKFVLNGYHLHEARFFSLGSLPSPLEHAAHRLMELQENNMAGIKPGETFESLMIDFRKNEKKTGLNNATGKLNETGTSLFGSGIGLEIIEPPLLVPGESTILQEGMVLSVFVGEATANGRPIGPRDVVLVTKNGSRKITRIPSQVFFP